MSPRPRWDGTTLTNVRSDRVKAVRALTQRSARERTQRYLVDGPQAVREAVRYAAPLVDDLYVTEAAVQRHREIVDAAERADVRLHRCDEAVMDAMSDTTSPQGLLAVVSAGFADLDAVISNAPRLLVVLAQVRDPGNAGTIIRGAAAFGADAVIVTDGSVEMTSPKVVRASAGSFFHLPIVREASIEVTLSSLHAVGINTYAAAGFGSTALPDVDLGGAHAWIMGNEAWGLPTELTNACTAVVSIPMSPRVESLNLAMAATVCLAASAGALAHGS